MNFAANKDVMLLVVNEKATLSKLTLFCVSVLKTFNIRIVKATTAIEGLLVYSRQRPCLVIVEDDLPDMRGCSLCAILKDAPNGGDAVNVFFIAENTSYLSSTKADFFFPKPLSYHTLNLVLTEFFRRRKKRTSAYLSEIEKAKVKQKADIPQDLNNRFCSVSCIFAPFDDLSGDGLDYWTVDDKDTDLYGFLFDCTGHDLTAYSQTSEIRSMLKLSFKLYLKGMLPSLGKLLHDLNNDLFDIYNGDPSPVSAILFHFDFEENVLHYCPAGIPCLYTNDGSCFTSVALKNPLIASFRGVDFEDHTLPLFGLQSVMFASDGLSELLFLLPDELPPYSLAKHDDVSGLIVDIKQQI